VAEFRTALCLSSLCADDLSGANHDVDEMVSQYSHVISTILLDGLIPVTTTTYRVRQSDPWYDDECRTAKRIARKLERRYKRKKVSSHDRSTTTSANASRELWLDALKTSHRLVEQKRRRFWRSQAASSTNPARLWQTFDTVLGRNKLPNSSTFSPKISLLSLPPGLRMFVT